MANLLPLACSAPLQAATVGPPDERDERLQLGVYCAHFNCSQQSPTVTVTNDVFEFEPGVSDPHCGARPLTRASARTVLAAVQRNCAGQMVLFDLDSTLVNNRPRSARIMREFAATQNEPLLAAAAGHHWQDWSATRAMRNMGLAAERAEALNQLFDDFWRPRFFSSDYCPYDTEIAGACAFVQSVLDAGAQVIYLTGRPELMRAGTVQSLTELGFPAPGSASVALNMKPQANGSDDDFKHQQALELRARGAIAAAFDNEPQHINTYRAQLPDCVCVHLYTDHSMRAIALLDGIASVRDFTPSQHD